MLARPCRLPRAHGGGILRRMSDHRKAPEVPPEYLPENTGTRWLPIAEVEGLIGKKERNARYWKESASPPETTGILHEPIEAAYRVMPEELERAIARTGERYVRDIQTVFDQVAALYEQRLAEKDALIITVREEKDALIAELRRRAEAAEVERDELRRQASPQPASEATTGDAATGTPAPPAPAGGFWQRIRRALGGE